jgi:hypothetical protein
MASPKDLVTVLYRPRATMRRVLDGGRDRWTIQIVVLAFICASVGDADISKLLAALPDLSLNATLALVALALLLIAACWIIVLYLFAWVATFIGRWLDGQGEIADVRAALAWGLVPVIWSVVLRIPLAVYKSRVIPQTLDQHRFMRTSSRRAAVRSPFSWRHSRFCSTCGLRMSRAPPSLKHFTSRRGAVSPRLH